MNFVTPLTISLTNNGPPESPWHVSFPPENSPAQICLFQSFSKKGDTFEHTELERTFCKMFDLSPDMDTEPQPMVQAGIFAI
ncbi:hypothetical protein BpHYR1_032575 [Brachionus plicatilis]|uniref:Uncharacterized protein n=1 Tax=Brachionus plicatilis TaxID=10195 RepID=A0A3M7R3L4_BRAPC|nr:hypothetical protein BpHYR1_032575 [Brachionus plicatilis]